MSARPGSLSHMTVSHPWAGESESERAVDKLYLSLSCYLAQENFILKNPPLLMIGRAQTYHMTTGFFPPIGFTCSFISGNRDSWLFARDFIFQGVLNVSAVLEQLAWARVTLKRTNWNVSEWWEEPGGVYRAPIYFLLLGLLCSELNWMLLARPSVLTLFWLWFCHSQAPYRVCQAFSLSIYFQKLYGSVVEIHSKQNIGKKSCNSEMEKETEEKKKEFCLMIN